MNLGEPKKELQVEPLQWPTQMPHESHPEPKAVPSEVPAEPVPAGKE